MKNLLIYINPLGKKFSPEHDNLTKMQIDNSLSLGWEPEDILLATNFNYEYRGIKSIVVDDYQVFDQNRSTKIPVINQLFRDGIIKDNIYWFHDHDAFQLEPFEVHLEKDAGFTNHGWSKTWNAGSFFFKQSAKDIFLDIWNYMNLRHTNEQNALTYMWQNNIKGINNRYQPINISYNVGIYYIDRNLKHAELPIKVAHFHPHKKRHLDLYTSRGLLPKRLLKIFKQYGIN
jgi:hypothetical protein